MTRVFSLLVLIGLMAALAPVVPTAAVAADTAPASPSAQGGLLQFTAGGHGLGFAPEAAYLATGSHALRVGFVGANTVQPQGEAGRGTSFTGVHPLGRVTYTGLWPGITLTYEAVEGGVAKSTYHLAPGADAGQIRLAYNVPVTVQADGSLRLAFATGEMSESAPVAWQEIEGWRVPVAVAFVVRGRTVCFRLGEHDPHYPLTIDPAYAWHTFYGGSEGDEGAGIAVDGSGSVYVTGLSWGTWQGDGGADPLHSCSGNVDIVVLKLDSDGAYQWHTFYGSNEIDIGRTIAVDSSGGVYVVGRSGGAWQGAGDASPLHPYSGDDDITLLKLDSDGAYQWHTFYGGSRQDEGLSITVDSSGGVYVTGGSRDPWQGDGDADPLHSCSGGYDITVLKLNSDGAYQWHTFYGSSSFDSSHGIALDGSNGIYVAGRSVATWQGDGGADPLHPHSEGEYIAALKLDSDRVYQYEWDDIAVLKLDSAGTYQWHTFYGAAGYPDQGLAVAVDGGGGVYVAGPSWDPWQGDDTTSPLHPHSDDGADITVLKLDSAGTYQWHTFYGSSGDSGQAVAVDGSGGVYVAGHSLTTWQGDGGADPLHAHNGEDTDIAVFRLDSDGTYRWHTFYGGSGQDRGRGIAVDGSGGVYVTGKSPATWQGDGAADPLHPYNGDEDITVLKLAWGYMVYLPLVVRNR